MRLNRGDLYTKFYANDICLLAVVKFLNMVPGLVQEAIDSWCSKIGMSVNPDKTELITFTRKKNFFGFFGLHFFGATLDNSMLFKCLR
jgi:hypothetical protein